MTFKREQNKKPAIERRAGFQILGWLMGLEPKNGRIDGNKGEWNEMVT